MGQMADVETYYRVYELGADGRISTPPMVTVGTLDDAFDEASRHLAGRIFEIWQGSRLVLRFEPSDEMSIELLSSS